MTRRFARLRRAPVDPASGASELPDNGFCLSVFLVIEPADRSGSVLMGRIDPTADWWEIGAMTRTLLQRTGERWMLPSSQLLLFESPAEAAHRVLAEQLGSPRVDLENPLVFSDPSERPGSSGRDPHWDFHFVYRGRWKSPTAPRAPAWKQLEFVDVSRTRRAEIARDQGDVLELVGLKPRD